MTRKTNFKWFTDATRKHLTKRAKDYLSVKIKAYWVEKKKIEEKKIYSVKVWGKVADYGLDGHKIFIESFAEKTINAKSKADKTEEDLIETLQIEIGNFFGFQLVEKLAFGSEQLERVTFEKDITIIIKYKYKGEMQWRQI